MELGTVKQLSEDVGNLLLDDARSVVAYGYAEAVVCRLLNDDVQIGQDATLFARVETVVDRFFDGRQQGLTLVVKAEKMTIFREKLRDGNLALLFSQRFRRRGSSPRLWLDRPLGRGAAAALGEP